MLEIEGNVKPSLILAMYKYGFRRLQPNISEVKSID